MVLMQLSTALYCLPGGHVPDGTGHHRGRRTRVWQLPYPNRCVQMLMAFLCLQEETARFTREASVLAVGEHMMSAAVAPLLSLLCDQPALA